jgi:hypothetical protein
MLIHGGPELASHASRNRAVRTESHPRQPTGSAANKAQQVPSTSAPATAASSTSSTMPS